MMLTVKQAAEELGVSAALIYVLCAKGRLECQRFGLGRGTIRISRPALDKLCEQSKGCKREPEIQLKHLKLPSTS